jgi:hypothetical protein
VGKFSSKLNKGPLGFFVADWRKAVKKTPFTNSSADADLRRRIRCRFTWTAII